MINDLAKKIDSLSLDEKKILSLKVSELLKSNHLRTAGEPSKRLVAYVKSTKSLDEKGLKKFLKERIPNYMIPSSIIEIDEMPLLPNGKIDKSKLAKQPKRDTKPQTEQVVASANPIEEKLVQIWQEVLQFAPINTNDNFFEIGGDSILSIQIVTKARKAGISITPNQLFEYQTIGEIVDSISNEEHKREKVEFVTPIRKEGSKTPLFCIHSGGGHVFFYGVLKNYLKEDRPIYTVNPFKLDGNYELFGNVEEMTNSYLKSIQEIQPKGPYNFLVYCFSTSVGNEMAIQLGKMGEDVNIVVMDTMASPWNATDGDSLKIRIMSFLKRFSRNPLTAIKIFLEDRIYLWDALKVKLFGNQEDRQLEALKANLRKISVDYVWKKHEGKASLIITDKADKNFNDFIIASWQKYAKGGISVYRTKGNHKTLFEESDISFVSQRIDECLID